MSKSAGSGSAMRGARVPVAIGQTPVRMDDASRTSAPTPSSPSTCGSGGSWRSSAFPEARKPAWKLAGRLRPRRRRRCRPRRRSRTTPRTSCVGRLVVGAINLGTKRIAGFRSEFLVLGGLEPDGTVHLLARRRRRARATSSREAGASRWSRWRCSPWRRAATTASRGGAARRPPPRRPSTTGSSTTTATDAGHDRPRRRRARAEPLAPTVD